MKSKQSKRNQSYTGLNPCRKTLGGISLRTCARKIHRWYMVNAKLNAFFDPSGPSWHSCTSDSGNVTSLSDVIEHKSLSSCTCFCGERFRSSTCKFHFRYDATFKPRIFNANCFRPIFKPSLRFIADSISGVVAVGALFWLSGAIERNFEMSSIGVGPEREKSVILSSCVNPNKLAISNTYWRWLFANVWSVTMDLAEIQTIILFRLPEAHWSVSMDLPYLFESLANLWANISVSILYHFEREWTFQCVVQFVFVSCWSKHRAKAFSKHGDIDGTIVNMRVLTFLFGYTKMSSFGFASKCQNEECVHVTAAIWQLRYKLQMNLSIDKFLPFWSTIDANENFHLR